MATEVLVGCHTPTLPHKFRAKRPAVSQHPSYNGVYLLGQDLLHFYQTFQISEGLTKHVKSSKATQIIWFKKLIESWKKSNHHIPQNAEEVSQFIFNALKEHPKPEIEELLSFYGLPKPYKVLPKGVKLELHTLPVDAKAVADGDTITVYVRASDPEEISLVPSHVLEANLQRKQARALRNYAKADALHQEIINSGYRVIRLPNEEVLARKYRIRLRGIDAPESDMPYGKEATEELTKIVQGKSLRILIYEIDCYGRFVGDVYCNDIFVQESLLRKGCAWYYYHYDKRLELQNWEQEAKEKKIGLWACSNPEEPWEWRKNQRNSDSTALHRINRMPKLDLIDILRVL